MHIVFAVARRDSLIGDDWMPKLHAYLAGACRQRQHFVHAIGGTADHVHLLLSMHPAESVANLVKELKGQSTRWVKENHLHCAFSWQTGYGAFSYSRSLVPAVKTYVENQSEHHRHVTFEEELADIFRKFNIDYQPQYMMRGFVESESNGDCRVPTARIALTATKPAIEMAGYHCQMPTASSYAGAECLRSQPASNQYARPSGTLDTSRRDEKTTGRGDARPLVACYRKNPFVKIKWLQTSPERATDCSVTPS